MHLPWLHFERHRELKQRRERLYRIAYAWCHNSSLADDLVGETLYKAVRSAAVLKDAERLDAWLFRILANCWKDHLRSAREVENIEAWVLVSPDNPEESHQRQEIATRVREAIALLPMGQRQVITLVDLEGLTYEEVSTALEVPIGTVMSRLCRARRSLADRLSRAREALRQRLTRRAEDAPATAQGRGRLRRVK